MITNNNRLGPKAEYSNWVRNSFERRKEIKAFGMLRHFHSEKPHFQENDTVNSDLQLDVKFY